MTLINGGIAASGSRYHRMLIAAGAAREYPSADSAADPLRSALLESRQRWRDLVAMAADIAFETDRWGRLVFVFPDPVLGWPASSLIGQPASLLLADETASAFDPFRPAGRVRRQRAWLRRSDGTVASLSFAATPLLDPQGRMIGARGAGIDLGDQDGQDRAISAALRRGEVLDHVLWRMRQEVLAPRMIAAALDALAKSVGGEGAAVLALPSQDEALSVPHQIGAGVGTILGTARPLLLGQPHAPVQARTPEGRPLLLCPCRTRSARRGALALWRPQGARTWDGEDQVLISSVTGVICIVLEHEAVQQEMAEQTGTDPLTSLLNRRAFMSELRRQIDRLNREHQPGTLMCIGADNFKTLNDRMGQEAGDAALRAVADLLRATVRPTDLVARLGGDEFAVWLNGADRLTAAERAETLRITAPGEIASRIGGADTPPVTMSIGIACHDPGSAEPVDALLKRADGALSEVKRGGRAHWRVAGPA